MLLFKLLPHFCNLNYDRRKRDARHLLLHLTLTLLNVVTLVQILAAGAVMIIVGLNVVPYFTACLAKVRLLHVKTSLFYPALLDGLRSGKYS